MSVLDLMLADARTPSGGYAHSGGLEPLLAGDGDAGDRGAGAAGVPAFIAARLATVGMIDAAVAAAACRARDLDALLELDGEWAARCPAEPLRRAARTLGRGLLRTAAVWFPDDPLIGGYTRASALTPRAVALGAVARAGGLDARQAARASLYDDAAGVAAAAVKLTPLDAALASGWVLALSAEIEARAAEAARATAAGLPSTSTPLLDRRALVHANTERRLFAS